MGIYRTRAPSLFSSKKESEARYSRAHVGFDWNIGTSGERGHERRDMLFQTWRNTTGTLEHLPRKSPRPSKAGGSGVRGWRRGYSQAATTFGLGGEVLMPQSMRPAEIRRESRRAVMVPLWLVPRIGRGQGSPPGYRMGWRCLVGRLGGYSSSASGEEGAVTFR